ncbi:ubiquinol-cytochrome-c reductase cytochrome c1 [Aspergillus ibericus CBS 121593]|uniref:Ubiquinol-cytochrome-c reductase cytochrome c1 n=1 Tax=Aspergillus ibericus CBS 121593 TaxID=1448316 RepID=A0A395GZF1_9EURO|nr:ubiquinol-cytochrome-c reductase cytochrome c1 [Aspergillus ibericus CBS 121593]RAL00740.1 ubiquinol-cytochrome-c reductase cytochrome c1 [Aspergillus ibericus CBS 121593]
MTKVPVSEQRQIFLACRAIFSGKNADLRKAKAIRTRLKDHEGSLRTLIPNYGLTRVLSVVKLFLEKGLFQSRAKAEMQFPGLFEPCPVRQTQHAVLEKEASQSTNKVLEGISSAYETERGKEEGEVPAETPAIVSVDAAHAPAEKQEQEDDSDQTLTTERPVASLFPLYLPYHAQHQILTTVQQVLEECIFDFMKKWLPVELESRGWDCAAAVELTKGTRLLAKWASRLPEDALRPADLKLDSILLTVVKIRHTAVHRLPTTAPGVCDFVAIAQKLTENLRDPIRTSQFEDLHRDLQDKIKILEFNKDVLEENQARELRRIEAEREQLNQREETLRAKTIEDDGENKLMMGLLLQETMEQIFKTGAVESETGRVWYSTADEAVCLSDLVLGLLRGELAERATALGFWMIGIFCFVPVFAWVLSVIV